MVTHIRISRSKSYSILSQVLSKLRYAYRRNRQNMFYHLVYFKIESEIAVKSYKRYFVCFISKNACSVSLTMF